MLQYAIYITYFTSTIVTQKMEYNWGREKYRQWWGSPEQTLVSALGRVIRYSVTIFPHLYYHCVYYCMCCGSMHKKNEEKEVCL